MPPIPLPRLIGPAVAVLLLPACSGDSPSPPPSPAPPLSFSRSVHVGGLCCLLYDPQIAVDGQVVYVAWTESIRYTTYLPMRRSGDGAASFPDQLSFDDATRGDRDRVRLATAPRRILHMVWEDSRNGVCDPFCRGYDIYATESGDGGSSFASSLPVDESAPEGGDDRSAALAFAAGGDVYAAWERRHGGERAIYFARRPDGGDRYGASLRVDAAAPSPRQQESPALALEPDGRIHLAWLDRRAGRREVYLARSGDRGATFRVGGPLHPRDPDVTDRDGLCLAVTGAGSLVAVWTEQRDDRWRVLSATSLDGGESFTSPRAVDGGGARGDQILPALAVHGAERVYVAWQDDRDGADRVRIARSTDGAETFEASVRVDDPGVAEGDQRDPALAVDAAGDVLVTWVDFSKPMGGVYVARSARD